MTTALIAEDEALLAEALRRQLADLWPTLQLLPTQADGHAALEAALAHAPQVCFLDIRMPGLSGLELAAALAEEWPEDRPFPLLVFVTAYDQYAVQAFDAQAVDYLVKPVQRDRLASCVQRLQARLQAGASALAPTLDQLRALLAPAPAAVPRLDVIPVQTGAIVRFVPVDEVLYLEAADKYVRVVTASEEHLVRASLRELLPQLDPQRFWQVHRGTVVQLRAVASARREESGRCTLTLHGRPEKLVVSRLYAHLFRGL